MKQFVVFMCSKCRNFTSSPVGQKRRRCSYCGSIIDITRANCALFDGHEQAMTSVKEFNASRGGDEFQKAVERSRDRYRLLMPDTPVDVNDIVTEDNENRQPGKLTRLMEILEAEARDRVCTLDRLEQLCSTHGLNWAWVERSILSLSNSGELIFPRPWEIQLVMTDNELSPKSQKANDVSLEIISFLRAHQEKIRIDELVKHFKEQGVSEESIDSSLERLMRRGDIFQPSVGYVCLV